MNLHSPRQSSAPARPLAGRVAVVTGSTSGIGLGIARSLAAAGASIVVNGLGQPETIAPIIGALRDECGVEVTFSPADMSDAPSIDAMIQGAVDAFGRLDILVNNAGIQHVSPIESFPAAKWNAILAINLSAVFHAAKAALPVMRRQGGGRIINVASAHGLVASPFKAAYVAAKHGVVGLTKVIALETAEEAITCNAVCPGYVWTPLVEAQIDEQARAHGIPREQVVREVLLAKQPNKRFAQVEELGALCAFLASDAGASITGAALPVDGGWTAQ